MRVGAFFVVLFVGLIAATSPANAQTDGLEYSEDVVFTILEDAVRVDLEARMVNTTEERREGETVFFSFFDTFVFVAPSGIDDLVIRSEGVELTSTSAPLDEDFDTVTAPLPEQLRSGEAREFSVSYTLPRGEIRTNAAFFSNPAYHGFPLWSFSDPGLGSLRLRVPEDGELSELGNTLRVASNENGFVEWVPQSFDRPSDFFTYVTVVRDDRFEVTNFEVSDQDIELRSWPGDEEWETFARSTIESGIPDLEDRIGLPIPEQDTLEVTASVTPFLFGYAGWYDPADTSIEIGNELNSGVMLHELSHAWFNQNLFVDRWLSEGFAEEFSWQADRALGEERGEEPTTPRPTDAGAVPLSSWGDPNVALGAQQVREQEVYGYNASWFVVRQLTDIVGVDGLRSLLAAADRGAPTYGVSTTTQGPNDWRRVLDLASNLTDTEGELELDQLWIDVVAAQEDIDLLTQRREARTQYQRFIDRTLQWDVPEAIEIAMAEWRFEEALAVLREANGVLDHQRRVMDQASLNGLTATEAARDSYEREVPDFARATSILDEQESAIQAVVDIREIASQPLDRQAEWGIAESDLSSFVDLAEAAYTANRFDVVESVHDELQSLREDARQAGASRLLWARIGLGVGIVLALIALVEIVRRYARKPIDVAVA